MARYLIFWDLDSSMVPSDPQERAAAWSLMLDMVEDDRKSGYVKDWAAYLGELAGYSVVEGDEMQVSANCQKYMPAVQFTVRPLTSVADLRQILASAPK